MATVTDPGYVLPVAGDDVDTENVALWIAALKTFVEGANIDGDNVNSSAANGLMVKNVIQTIAAQKTFTKATFTEITTIGYFTTMQLGPLYVTAGEAITAGDLVYVSAWDATNSCFTVKKAIATTVLATTLYAKYFAPAAIANAAQGVVCQVGVLTSQVTTNLTAGRPVFLSATGGLWTGTLPAVSTLVQVVGEVVTVHSTAGRVAITLPGSLIPWSIADQV